MNQFEAKLLSILEFAGFSKGDICSHDEISGMAGTILS